MKPCKNSANAQFVAVPSLYKGDGWSGRASSHQNFATFNHVGPNLGYMSLMPFWVRRRRSSEMIDNLDMGKRKKNIM